MTNSPIRAVADDDLLTTAEQTAKFQPSHTPLTTGARRANMTPPGLGKIAVRTGNLVIIDSHDFVLTEWLDDVIEARAVLGPKSARQKGKTV